MIRHLTAFIGKIGLFITNPHFAVCFITAWFITNGWSYLALIAGTAFRVKWMSAIASTYLTFLWLPFTPEKIITVIIAVKLLKKLFPEDRQAMELLHEMNKGLKDES